MSNITAYTALATPQSDDVLPIVDVHDTTMASSGTTKKITIGNLLGLAPSGDTTGVTDTANVQGLLNLAGVVPFQAGTFWLKPVTTSTGNRIRGSGYGTVLKMIASGPADNLLKSVSVSDVHISDLTLDGNKGAQANHSYGLYFASCTDCSAERILTRNWHGDGTQLYNCDRVTLTACWSTGNDYHGFEVEQCRSCTAEGCYGYSNTLHGLIITPGEIGGTGSKGNAVLGGAYNSNGQYGVCVNSDNAGAGSFLSEGNKIIGTSVVSNTQYGICLYQENKTVIESCYVSGNGFFGLYGYQSSYNTVQGNYFHNNSQAGNGSYDEIFFEGNSSGHAAVYNLISGNTIQMDGGTKARWGINEGSSSDGPNTILGNVIPAAGTSGTINSLCATDVLTTPAGVFQIYGTQAIQGANAGIDGAFANVMRLYNNFSGGTTQIVNPNGNVNFYVGGNDVMDVDSTGPAFRPDVSTTAGGHVFASVGNGSALGLYWGSGAPTISAPQGSLYLRTDGSSGTRAYINTNGSTGWTGITTAA